VAPDGFLEIHFTFLFFSIVAVNQGGFVYDKRLESAHFGNYLGDRDEIVLGDELVAIGLVSLPEQGALVSTKPARVVQHASDRHDDLVNDVANSAYRALED
jgi:hypothetical protein